MSSTDTTLIHSGLVHSMCPGAGPAEALVVRDGTIVATGTNDDMRAAAGAGARRLDLQGASVLPGLIDTHPHMYHFGIFNYPLVDLADARDHDDIVARLRAKVAETPAGQWVMATPVGEPHYFLRRSWRDLAERRLPDRHVLDRASTEHPIFLQAWGPSTPNVCAFNTAGLRAIGIEAGVEHRRGNIWIEKDSRGEPTGILRGSVNTYYTGEPAMDALLADIPLVRPELIPEALAAAMAEYNRMGVTSVYEGHVISPLDVSVFQMLRAQDALTVRVLTCLEAENYSLPNTPVLSEEEFVAGLELALSTRATDDEFLRHNGVTLSRGGPFCPGFLRMHEPYIGPYGQPTCGETFVSEAKERIALDWCARHDLRLNFIGAGYRDHDEFLANAEEVDRRHGIRGRRWILQHNYLCTEEHARRYAALGFEVTTSMSFSWAKGDLMAYRLGRHVWDDLIPLARLLEAGLEVSCGSDWGPKNIFEHIALATTHEFAVSGHRNDTPAHKVTREQAIAMWTRTAAHVLGWERTGQLAPGYRADLIVCDRDVMSCPEADLPATGVLRTLLGGRTVHDSGALPG